MRIQEIRHPGEWWLMYVIGNLSAIDSDYVRSFAVAWLFKENGKWVLTPRFTGNTALYYNAVFFVRWTTTPLIILLPIITALVGSNWPALFLLHGLFWSFRWSASSTSKALWQAGIGWKLNGRFAPLFRFQSDESSATGVTGPNFGQATGFNYGTH